MSIDKILEECHSTLKNKISEVPSFFILELFRFIDFSFLAKENFKSSKDKMKLFENSISGWGLVTKHLLEQKKEIFPFIHSNIETEKVISSFLNFSTNMSKLSQLIDFEKAHLGYFKSINDRNWDFRLTSLGEKESLEKYFYKYFSNFKAVVSEEKEELSIKEYEDIKLRLNSFLLPAISGWEVRYKEDDIINDFYRKVALAQMVSMNLYEEFSENDMFGGIKYGMYLDFIQYQTATALRHVDFCMAHHHKYSTDIYDNITIVHSKESFIKPYCSYSGLPYNIVEKLFDCICLTPTDKWNPITTPLPPFIECNNKQVIRSVAALKISPCSFLNRKLKSLYLKDYESTFNEREARFRKELYDLFEARKSDCPTLHYVFREVKLRRNSCFITDIDASIFDASTKTLALFQLKWQDVFGPEMKERNSRIKNLIPKCDEWIDKITTWYESTDKKEIMNSLKFEGVPQNILPERLCLFIVARNHVHFTSVELQESVAWASWFQLFYLITKTKFKGDFLKTLHSLLKQFNTPIKYQNISYKVTEKITLLDYSIRIYSPNSSNAGILKNHIDKNYQYLSNHNK